MLEVRKENEKLSRENEKLATVRGFCKKYKIRYDTYYLSEREFEEGVMKALSGFDIDSLIYEFEKAKSAFKEIKKEIIHNLQKREKNELPE